MTRQQDDLAFGVRDLELFKQFQPRHTGHEDIGENDIKSLGLTKRDGFTAVCHRHNIVSTQAQGNFQRHARAALIVNNQHSRGVWHVRGALFNAKTQRRKAYLCALAPLR